MSIENHAVCVCRHEMKMDTSDVYNRKNVKF